MSARSRYGSGTLRQYGPSWYGLWYVDGRRVKRRLGPVEGMTRREAEVELRAMMAAERPRDEQLNPPGVELTVAGVGELVKQRQRLAGRQLTTIQAFEVNVRRHLVPFFGERDLGSIETRDVDRLTAAMLDQGLALKTGKNVRGDLAAIFNYAIREGWLARNPVAGAIRPRDPDEDLGLRFLSVEQVFELGRLGAQDDELGREVEADLYVVAAMTGARQGELLALRVRDVDFASSSVRIERKVLGGKFGPTKGREKRTVPLGARVLEVLAARVERLGLDGDELVFGEPGTGLPISRYRISGERFSAACRRAGVPVVTFHELRHTFGTTLAASGTAIVRIQAWMGHKDIATTQKYLHYAPLERDAAEIDRAFGGAFVPLEAE